MSSKNLLSMALTAAAAFLSFVVHADDTQAVNGVWTKSSWSAGFSPSENNVIYGLLPDTVRTKSSWWRKLLQVSG